MLSLGKEDPPALPQSPQTSQNSTVKALKSVNQRKLSLQPTSVPPLKSTKLYPPPIIIPPNQSRNLTNDGQLIVHHLDPRGRMG